MNREAGASQLALVATRVTGKRAANERLSNAEWSDFASAVPTEHQTSRISRLPRYRTSGGGKVLQSPPNEAVEKPTFARTSTGPHPRAACGSISLAPSLRHRRLEAAPEHPGSRPHSLYTPAIFSMLWTMVKSCHWAFTLVRPRRVKRRMPLFWILPKTGSTVPMRLL